MGSEWEGSSEGWGLGYFGGRDRRTMGYRVEAEYTNLWPNGSNFGSQITVILIYE